MERAEIPKLKKAVVSLKKLDLLREIPVSEGGKKENKESSRTFDDSEDPSSENVSTGSGDSNTICTDDDDLEKKIQAFSIPVKKESEKPNTKNEKDTIKNGSDKSALIDKRGESIKLGKKVTFSFLKSDAKSKTGSKLDTNKSVQPEGASVAVDTDSTSRGTRKKKENFKDKSKSDEEKSISHENKPSAVKQKSVDINDIKPPNSDSSSDKSPFERNLRNGKDDKNNEKVAERKTRKDQHSSNSDMVGTEVFRKRKAQKENVQVPQKRHLSEKISPKVCSEPTTSAPVKDKNKRTIEKILRSTAIKKTVLLKKASLKVNDKSHLNVKRSTRISNAAGVLQGDEQKRKEQKSSANKTSKKSIEFKKSSENQQKSKVDARKRTSDNKNENNDSPKLKKDDNTIGNKIKEKVSEKRVTSTVGKKSNHNMLIPKEEYAKALLKVTGLGKRSKQTPVTPEVKKSISKVQNSQKNCSDIFADGELLEKICDILEDASGMPESKGVEKENLSKLQPVSNRIVSPSKERVVIPEPSFFRPKIFHKNSRFPSNGNGTVSYKKLWKWSHYVKMPSDMWSLHKHPDGNFVIIFHISEMSPFPKLIIDKCIIFKETASPNVKIYGKDVLALSSENELQTLGNVCGFLKHLHDISLCEGMLSPLTGENNSNCELYTDGKVSSPYKCKYCL